MEQTLLRLLNVRYWLLILSKFMGIGLCIFYISNAQSYKVEWSLLTFVFPTITLKLSNILSLFGTYILCIPLAIIITSLLLPDNKSLQITSSLLGVTSTIFAVASGLFRNQFGEVYDLRVVVVKPILTLVDKHQTFIREYKKIILEQYENPQALYLFLEHHLEEKYFQIYDEYLKKVETLYDVKVYAKNTILELVTRYHEAQTISAASSVYKNPILIIVGVTIICLIVIIYFKDDFVVSVASDGVKAAEYSEKGTLLIHDLGGQIKNIVGTLQNHTEVLQSHINVVKLQEAAITKLRMDNASLTKAINYIINTIQKLHPKDDIASFIIHDPSEI